MRSSLIAASVLLLTLSGCGMFEKPQTEAQIRSELDKFPRDRSGKWAMHFVLDSFSESGIPAAAEEGARREIEGRGRLGNIHCTTPAEAKSDPFTQLRNFDGATCQVLNFHSDGKAFDARLKCNYDNMVDSTVEISGAGSADSQTFKFSVSATSKKHENFKMSYSGIATAERTGECPAQ